MALKQIVVRVLVDVVIIDHPCKSGELIKADKSVLDQYLKSNEVDDSKEGIDYAISQGAEVRAIEMSVKEQEPADPPKEPAA